MQLKHFFIAGFLSLISFASCSKKNDDFKNAVPIEGNWVGKYSILSQPYNDYYSFKIKAGGLLELQDAAGQKTGQGSWELSNENTVIAGTYTHLPPASRTYSFIANFNNATGKLNGTWGMGTMTYGGGYWFMNRSN